MPNQEWLGYALAAMLLFSAANIVLKLVVNKATLEQFKPPVELLAGGIVVVLAIALFVLSQSGLQLSQSQLQLAALFAILSITGFAFLLNAVANGKIALVNAVLALSTVAVALLSYIILGEKFETKEFAAMILAMASVVMLVW